MLYNLSLIELMGDDDPEFIKTLISVFAESIPPDLESLNQAADTHDWKHVSFMAHKIKSTIDNLGIESLKSVIRILEANSIINELSEDDIISYVKEVTAVMTDVVNEMKLNYPSIEF